MSRRILQAAGLIIALWLLAGCRDVGTYLVTVQVEMRETARALATATVIAEATDAPTSAATSPAQAGAANDVILLWEDSSQSPCQSLAVTAAYMMTLGPCGRPTLTQNLRQEDARDFLNTMQARLGAIDMTDNGVHLAFKGGGAVTSPAWTRALMRWAKFTYAEGTTGHVCAACRTAMSWSIREQPGQPGVCGRLIVLNFGYAYAETLPCGGGTSQVAARGLIETGRWEVFDNWLGTYQPYTDNVNSFDGQGAEPLRGAVIASLDGWAQATYADLLAVQGAATPSGTP